MRTIAFVNPPFSIHQQYGLLSGACVSEPPFGLCSLAGAVRGGSHSPVIIDAPARGWGMAQVLDALRSLSPDVIGITATTSSYRTACALASEIRHHMPAVMIIAGGPHVSALPERSLREESAFDIIVQGEGEETLKELLSVRVKTGEYSGVRGIWHRVPGSGQIQWTGMRPRIEDLDRLGMPAFDLLEGFPERYGVPAQSADAFPAVSLVTSRGCLGRCRFCSRSVFGNHSTYYSASFVYHMMIDLHEKYGINHVLFEDDSFTQSRRVIDFARMAVAGRNPVTWGCSARADALDGEMLALMRRAGCRQVLVGIESGSAEMLHSMGKGITPQTIERAVVMIHSAGMRSKGFVMLGAAGETMKSMEETRRFSLRIPLDDISVTYFTPYPGSDAYGSAAASGTVSADWTKYSQFHPVFIPHGLSEHELMRGVSRLYMSFYLRGRIILGYCARLRSIHQLVRYMRALLSMIRYFFHKGINDSPCCVTHEAAADNDHGASRGKDDHG